METNEVLDGDLARLSIYKNNPKQPNTNLNDNENKKESPLN